MLILTKLKTLFLESEYDYLDENYIYTDGVYDDYYENYADYYEESGGPNRGDQSLVSPDGNIHFSKIENILKEFL